MMQRQRILVAIERGTNRPRAVAVARRIAKARGADVDVLHVLPQRTVDGDEWWEPWSVRGRDDGRVSLGSRIASMLRSDDSDGVRVRSVTLRGTPEHVIPAYSQIHQATLLVVPRDYGSGRFWHNGRVINELARRSPVPVLVLPKQQRRGQRQPGLRRILAPVDFSVASAVALRTVADLSRRHDARVTLVHALEGVPPHMVFSGSEAWAMARRLPARLDAVTKRLRAKAAVLGVDNVDTEVATGDAHRAILDIASRTGYDLVVMGIPHRSWLDRVMFGSTLRRVLRRATVPVLAVPVVAGKYTWPDDVGADRVSRSICAEPAADRVAA
jgi:nucleotide-binding universal stress UspA family protein